MLGTTLENFSCPLVMVWGYKNWATQGSLGLGTNSPDQVTIFGKYNLFVDISICRFINIKIKNVWNYPKKISYLTETFRGCQIHFRKIQLDKDRVVVELSFLFYRVFLCGVRVIFS